MTDRLIVTIPSDAEYRLKRAMEAQGRENPESVLSHFDGAIAAEPRFATAWNEKANYLDSLGRFEDALRCYDGALALDPGFAEAWFNKGLTLKKMGKDALAATCINRGIELSVG